MNSAIYQGIVRHRRFSPIAHEFHYSVFLLFLDLDELALFDRFKLCSATDKPALAWFKRSDFLQPTAMDLKAAVRLKIKQLLHEDATGPIRLLTHIRYYNYCFNPVSFYYCYDDSGETLKFIVAEVTNTPWGERYCYAFSVDPHERVLTYKREKAFHVSPLLPMTMHYEWRFTPPGEKICVAIKSFQQDQKIFDALLRLQRIPLTQMNINKMLMTYPWMTVKVMLAIHWQALKLWLKGAKFYPHP